MDESFTMRKQRESRKTKPRRNITTAFFCQMQTKHPDSAKLDCFNNENNGTFERVHFSIQGAFQCQTFLHSPVFGICACSHRFLCQVPSLYIPKSRSIPKSIHRALPAPKYAGRRHHPISVHESAEHNHRAQSEPMG